MSQRSILLDILQDGRVHTVKELLPLVYGKKRANKSNRLAARVGDLKYKYGYEIVSNPINGANRSAWFYQMVVEKSHVLRKTQELKKIKA